MDATLCVNFIGAQVLKKESVHYIPLQIFVIIDRGASYHQEAGVVVLEASHSNKAVLAKAIAKMKLRGRLKAGTLEPSHLYPNLDSDTF